MAVSEAMRKRLQDKVKGKGKTAKDKPPVPPALAKDHNKAIVDLETSIIPAVKGLKIASDEDYTLADNLFGRMTQFKTWWGERMNPILEPLNAARNAALKFDQEVRLPLDKNMALIKRMMGDYLTEKNIKAAQAQIESEAQVEDLQQQEQQLTEKIGMAKTTKLKEKLAERRAEVQQQIEQTVEEAQTVETVKGANSQARYMPAWRLTDIRAVACAIVLGYGDGEGVIRPKFIPLEAITIDEKWLNQYFKDHPEQVMEWPGVEVWEKPIIASVRS